MTQTRDTTFNASSPRSSSGGGADSNRQEGTPVTRLTTFSPDDGAHQSHRHFQPVFGTHGHAAADKSKSAANDFDAHDNVHVGNYHQRHTNTQDKDPFVTSKQEKQLSPTASSFRPLHAPLVAHGSLQSTSQFHSHSAQQPPNSSGGHGKANVGHLPPYVKGIFSFDQGLSRYLSFSSRRLTAIKLDHLETFLQHLSTHLKGRHETIERNDKCYIRFTNVHDAALAYQNARDGPVDWSVDYVTASEFLQANYMLDAMPAGSHSTALVRAEPIPNGLVEIHAWSYNNVTIAETKQAIVELMDSQGDLLAIREIASAPNHHFAALAEFADVDDAIKAARLINGIAVMDGRIRLTVASLPVTTASGANPESLINAVAPTSLMASPSVQAMTNVFQTMGMANSVPVQPQHPQITSTSSFGHSPTTLQFVPPSGPMQPISIYQTAAYHHQSPTRYVVDQTPTRGPGIGGPQPPLTPIHRGWSVMPPMYAQTPPVTPLSPYGGYHGDYASPRGSQLQVYNRSEHQRRQHALRVNRSPYFHGNGTGHNTVNVDRIREGTDVRTTIMLRNIPNKVDQAMLKRIIDESSWGKYDFMYLRIDFANDCNVGYAFINFVDPLDIIDFYNARGNKRWNCFKSDKIAEISYATIQGKDCLVQKFRNSSVMLELEHYRPKLFYTSNGPRPELAGQEEPFPPPDNQSKMKRSCENAEHVGLFTPNAGQHYRDEQRRRRSQFDRGTRLAALEEYGHDYNNTNYHPPQSVTYATQPTSRNYLPATSDTYSQPVSGNYLPGPTGSYSAPQNGNCSEDGGYPPAQDSSYPHPEAPQDPYFRQ